MFAMLGWRFFLKNPVLPFPFAEESHEAVVQLQKQGLDPYGYPRPGADQIQVPLRTSFFFQLSVSDGNEADFPLPDSVGVTLQAEGGEAVDILSPDQKFSAGYSGILNVAGQRRGGKSLTVYIDSEKPLRPNTRYTVRVTARSREGASLPPEEGIWSFTTEGEAATHPLSFRLDLKADPVQWHGAFFSGFLKPSFCTSLSCQRIPGYELMNEARKRHPKAWSLQRDFWMTGMQAQGADLGFSNLPNVVREKETRRIKALEPRADEVVLRIEDFFGHEQYGIPSGRPIGDDYHPGDEVLIADGVSSARAKVLSADDASNTLVVSAFEQPNEGWKIEYAGPLPEKEDPNAPGLFPPGGCFLRKFNPCGTAHYYWGRLDLEFDIAHRRFGRRLSPNFTDAPGDLSVDGKNWTYPKDYVQLHDVTRAITSHLIERYGDACLDFVWSVFNEPDLSRLFWISEDWDALQIFYDYTVDAVLRAFEDHGYDSDRVFIGGLELGAVAGTKMRLREFLAHCSPRAEAEGALHKNAAFADSRLAGKRSRRVERLCGANDGRGSPCDFISIHSYNRSEMMAAKMIRAKEMALEIDPEYYDRLWVNSHEACPEWNPPPDLAAGDSYLGNGFFPTWCADVVWRQLRRAAEDARYGYGESILTFWPWPNHNFVGNNACTRLIHVDDDGDGQEDRAVTVPMPIFHFLTLLCAMGDDYWVLPTQEVGGHHVAGFATLEGDELRVLLYAHHGLDIQSRSDADFEITFDAAQVPWAAIRVTEYRFDKEHNTYYDLGRRLRRGPASINDGIMEELAGTLEEEVKRLGSATREERIEAIRKLASQGAAARSAIPFIERLVYYTTDEELRRAAYDALRRITSAQYCYSPQEVEQVEELAKLRNTGSAAHTADSDGRYRLTVRVAGNGANFLVITPEKKASA